MFPKEVFRIKEDGSSEVGSVDISFIALKENIVSRVVGMDEQPSFAIRAAMVEETKLNGIFRFAQQIEICQAVLKTDGAQGLCTHGDDMHAHRPAGACVSCTLGDEWMGRRGALNICVGQQRITKLGCEKEMYNCDRMDLSWDRELALTLSYKYRSKSLGHSNGPGMGQP
ncbi:hypothetical protein VNO78_03399 [Psophocarpus tetragonolobus]|uniref:Uncharacterized protein n=1 Tax=Psophocarpus tetragonolobus TaxID=3891 RepID=A0AAN9T312_PSOTE